ERPMSHASTLRPNPVMTRVIVNTALALAALFVSGCVSRAYVDEQVAEARDRAGSVDRRFEGGRWVGGGRDTDDSVTRKHQVNVVTDQPSDAPAPAAPDSVDQAASSALGRADASKVEEQTVLFRSGSSELSHEDEDMLTDLAQRVKSDDRKAYVEI